MSISFDCVSKVYRDTDFNQYGVEVYDSFTCNTAYYNVDINNLEGLDILREIAEGDMSCEEELMNIIEKIDDMHCHIFIDGEVYEWEQIEDIIKKMMDSYNNNEDDDEYDEEDNE